MTRSIRMALPVAIVLALAWLASPAWSQTEIPTERVGVPRLISAEATYDCNPALMVDSAGTVWAGWVGWTDGVGEQVYVTHAIGDRWSEPVAVSAGAGNYVRPVLVEAGETLYAFWTATGEVETSIWMAARSAGQWQRPVRVSPERGRHHEPAAAVDRDGTVWLAWQGVVDDTYDIYLRSYDGSEWGETVTVTTNPGNDWNPAVACDSAGRVWIAWSGFAEADYDIQLAVYADGELSAPRRLSDHAAYDMHATLAIDPADRVWVAWDRMAISGHTLSGDSRTEGLARRSDQRISGIGNTDGTIEVRCIDGDDVLAPAQQIPQPPGPVTQRGRNQQLDSYHFSYSAYPQLAVDGAGAAWVICRAYVHPHWNTGLGEWWDVFAYRYSGDRWDGPYILRHSDGFIDPPAVAVGDEDVWFAYHKEYPQPGRRTVERTPAGTSTGVTGYGKPGRFGDIYVASLVTPPAADAVLTPAPELSAEPSSLSQLQIPAEAGRYQTTRGDTQLNLYWGDLHKHTTVLCVFNPEPEADTWFQYSRDVYQHDFSAVTDHQHNDMCMSDYQWWDMQRLADLYNAPGSYVTFYGSEIKLDGPLSEGGGHRNVIYHDRPVPNHAPRHHPPTFRGVPGETIEIPHVPFAFDSTIRPFDPNTLRLVEVFQAMRASSEHAGAPREFGPHTEGRAGDHIHAGLEAGYRFGLIASSDHGFGGAYAAVWAEDLTRESLFDALHSRRCYGATAYGIVLDVRADGHMMGEQYETDGPVEMSIFARTYGPIVQIDLFRDQQIVRTWGHREYALLNQRITPAVQQVWARLDADGEDIRETNLQWTDEADDPGQHNYYVRVILADGEMAWSSPIFVTRE